MASKSSKSAKAGAGPGVATAGQVKSTQTPVFGTRVASKRGGRKSSRGRGR